MSAALTKNARRRAKRKQQRGTEAPADVPTLEPAPPAAEDFHEVPTYIEPAPAPVAAPLDPAMSRDFAAVLERFAPPAEDSAPEKAEVIYSDDDMLSDDGQPAPLPETTMSRRQLRELQRLSVGELKQLVRRPEAVELVDVASTDPRLLIHLKSYRNAVPVPSHWSQKREYLAHRRGREKPPYELPSYIADTGIASLRDAVSSSDASKTLKAKTRERAQPKLGRMDIDYQRLHDAFFRFQTKPPLTTYGETYFEGKDGGSRARHRRPGDLSPALREALSIPPLAPLPWLIAMQRHGPPPSYPHMRIPGLNAPIPEGAQWGFHTGGWGRPPLDERGQPLYGDVFGEEAKHLQQEFAQDPPQRERWGEIEPTPDDEMESDSSDEDEDADEEQPVENEDEDEPTVVMQPDEPSSGLETPSGIQSVPEGLETPAHIELRKQPAPMDDEASGPPPSLYQVIPEREAGAEGRGFMGSERLYDLRHARS